MFWEHRVFNFVCDKVSDNVFCHVDMGGVAGKRPTSDLNVTSSR